MSKNPIVSIIMSTYNRASFIAESLKSIKAQTFEDWECLIIDDGSTDNTTDILESFLNQDKRFKYYKRNLIYKKGLPGSRNYGLDLAKGIYIIFMDDDDIAHPQNLEICVAELKNTNISFCRYIRDVFKGSFDYNFDYSKEYSSFYIDKQDINKILKNELQFNSCAVMWKKECYLTNRYVEHLMYAEEWELYSRIISKGFIGISIDKILFYGRKHEASNTGEFFKQDSIRVQSNSDAIVLVMSNLVKQKLVTDEIPRYFIQLSLDYKKYNLYERILNTLNLPLIEKFKWNLFYKILPIKLYFYKLYKYKYVNRNRNIS